MGGFEYPISRSFLAQISRMPLNPVVCSPTMQGTTDDVIIVNVRCKIQIIVLISILFHCLCLQN